VCLCKGAHRSFQQSDGYCICEPGYEFFDANFNVKSEANSDVDCQPVVFNRCTAGQERAADGTCKTSNVCNTECPSGAGQLNTVGLCECTGVKSVAQICDAACQAQAATISMDASGNLVVSGGGVNSTTVFNLMFAMLFLV
jgi:hypothetical protein